MATEYEYVTCEIGIILLKIEEARKVKNVGGRITENERKGEKPVQVSEPELLAKVKEPRTPCCQRGITKGKLVQRSLGMLPLGGIQPSLWGEPGATPRQQEGETDGKDKKGGTHWALLHSPVMASD